MDWYQNLYVGKTAKENESEIIRKVEEGKRLLLVYLIIVAPGEQNQLEILSPSEYRRQALRKGESLIVGVARGMREAKELIRQMTEDIYRATGEANLKEYFLKHQKDAMDQKKDTVDHERN